MAQWRGFRSVIDIETGGLNRRQKAPATSSISDFFRASQQPDYTQSHYFQQSIDPHTGKPYQLLEFAGEGVFAPNTWQGFQNDSVFLRPHPDFAISSFARQQGILHRSETRGMANLSEEQFAQSFYHALQGKIQTNAPVQLRAWNGLYDLSFLENLTHRYDSLRDYRGWFGRMADRGQFSYAGAEDSLFQLAWKHGQENPGFAQKYFRVRPTGAVAQSAEELRQVPFWSIENVTNALGGYERFAGSGAMAHSAGTDARVTEELAGRFDNALELVNSGIPLEEALQSQVLTEGTTAGFFERLFSTSWSHTVAEDTRRGASLLRSSQAFLTAGRSPWMVPGVALGVAAAGAIAAGLAFGKRKDRQTQITALSDAGIAPVTRHILTPFGSGWRGLTPESSQHKVYAGSSILAAGILGHRYLLAKQPGYAERVYTVARQLEKRSPRQVLGTLGISERASQYLPGTLTLNSHQLFQFRGASLEGKPLTVRTRIGDHLQRLLPTLDLDSINQPLTFRREDSSAYLRLHIGEERTGHRVSFVRSGVLGGDSELFGNPHGVRFDDSQRSILWKYRDEDVFLQPYLAKTDGRMLQNLNQQASRELFTYTNRLNRMLHEVHLGLPESAFNNSNSLVRALLLRRVAPAVVGIAGLSYLDYALGHKPSNSVWDATAKAHLLWADVTDQAPGARKVTDWYKEHVPGAQYGPLALPATGALIGGLAHFARVVSGQKFADTAERVAQFRKYGIRGALAGAALILPLLPGMLGSRKTGAEVRSEYAGETPVAIRSGRWWTMGVSPFGGNRILMYRPHAYALHQSHAEDISLYGSEEEKWSHNPLLHPFRWLKDPNYLAEKHSADRPYPVTSPAFSNVPLIGPLLAATVGKLVAPPHRMHEQEWDGSDYTLYTKAVEPHSPRALKPLAPEQEFGLKQTAERSQEIFEEDIGLPGFLLKSFRHFFHRKEDPKPDVHFEGTRNLNNWAHRYAEKELGAIPGPHPQMGLTSYSEPIRRFLVHERGTPAVNEIKNQMPSWLPDGDHYFIDFHKGDIYSRLPYGSVRLPGTGYAALHPTVQDIDPENYPDIEKLRILGDVAPYSLAFKQMAKRVGKTAKEDTALRIDYEKIVARARDIRESSVQFGERQTGPTEEIQGTIRAANDREFQLEEYPGRFFQYSGIGARASDLSAIALGDSNREIAADVDRREQERRQYLAGILSPGTNVRVVLPRGGASVTHSRAVLFAGNTNINQALIDHGYAVRNQRASGAEAQAMDNLLGRSLRSYAEALSFTGDESVYNPLRYVPRSVGTKLWHERTPLETYINEEVSGTRMRRWQRPIHDFAEPYFRGAAHLLTGNTLISRETQEKRDLDTLADQLEYLRAIYDMRDDPENRGKYSLQAQGTSIGANLFGETDRLPRTLPSRERKYFAAFARETNPDERSRILNTVSREMSETLLSQWTKEANAVKKASGTSVENFNFSGRYVDQADIDRLADMEGTVTKVIDGDSLVVKTAQGKKEVRLANINTPEMTEYAGRIAKSMTEKLALGKHIRLHSVGSDKYDRTVADVFTDDKRILNYELLNSGHAQKEPYQNKDGTDQKLSVGDYFRAREIAEFFARRGLHLPDPGSESLADDIDYQDVKAKIVQWEGQDFHDFGIYDDRVALLWRKPYLDGAVRELTSGDSRSVEQTSKLIEQAIFESKAGDPKARVRVQQQQARRGRTHSNIDIEVQPDEELKREVRRNREEYQ